MMTIRGWVECEGTVLASQQVEDLVSRNPGEISRLGGEFLISWDNCIARDLYGIMPGECNPGTVACDGRIVGKIHPEPPDMDLEASIITAVRLRSGDDAACALSGGVDSALVAKLAGRPCVAMGMEGCHDLARARHAAGLMELPCEYVVIRERDVEEALAEVVPVIPVVNPVEVSIAASQYFITRWAGEQGFRQVLTGQGADELFGGYARYLDVADPGALRARDFASLRRQGDRDQAVAALHGIYFSLPYLDVRVVRAARAIPAGDLVRSGVRKYPLREVAERHIPPEIAWYDKKAMQYGSGIWKIIRKLARHNGYKKAVQDYINQFGWRKI